jgi:cell wall-active antibiotic response 4TMS protein YvqF
MTHDLPDRPIDRHFVFGLVLILVGTMMTLNRGYLVVSGSFWPFLLLLLAAVKLVDPPVSPRGMRSRRGGAWLLFIGLWGLVNEFHLLGFSYDTSWPLVIVGVGLMLIWGALERSREPARMAGDQTDMR